MNGLFLTLADSGNAAAAGGGIATMLCMLVVWLGVVALGLAGLWKTFVKAGRPGWEGIVPIYNLYILNQLAGREILWFILTLIPCTAIVAVPLICIDFAKKFGKSPLFGLGLAFLSPIFFPILGFGSATWQGGSTAGVGGFPVMPPK